MRSFFSPVSKEADCLVLRYRPPFCCSGIFQLLAWIDRFAIWQPAFVSVVGIGVISIVSVSDIRLQSVR
jgi:hypothetical protein